MWQGKENDTSVTSVVLRGFPSTCESSTLLPSAGGHAVEPRMCGARGSSHDSGQKEAAALIAVRIHRYSSEDSPEILAKSRDFQP